MRRWRRSLIASIAAGLALGSSSGIALAADESVSISGFAFHPASLTITVGDRVTWTNDDATPHSATATGTLTFNSGDLDPGASYAATFATAGSYAYICAIHPTMTGTIQVVTAGAGLTPAPTDADPSAVLDPDRDGPLAMATMAVLGLATLIAMLVTERRVRPRR